MMVLAGTVSSPSLVSRTTTTTTTRRHVGRPVVTASSRPPILMEFTDISLHWGLVGDAKPKHVLPYSTVSSNNSSNSSNVMMLLSGNSTTASPPVRDDDDTTTVSGGDDSSFVIRRMHQSHVSVGTWYRALTPLLQQVYHSLGPDGKERRVVVLLPPHFCIPCCHDTISNNNNIILPTNFKAALLQCLLHNNNELTAGSSATTNTAASNIRVSIQSSISFVPYALPMISIAMLLIHVGLCDNNNNKSNINISCMIHAAGHSLPFTFQTILFPAAADTSSTNATVRSIILLDELILAIIKCLLACPRGARKHAIQNIVFCGPGVLHRPELPVRVEQRLQQVLRQQSWSGAEEKTDDTATAARPQEPQDDAEEEPTETTVSLENRTIYQGSFGIVPVNLKELQPLAELVGWVDYIVFPQDLAAQQQHQQHDQRRRRPRPDLLAWTGASLWAWHWHNHAQNDAQFHWIGK